MRWLVAVVVAAGCGSRANAPDGSVAGDDDAAVDASPDAGPPGWETVHEVKNDGDVIVEDVTYRSEGLLIKAHLCRPAAGGKHPALIYNHGGFQGLAIDTEAQRCEPSAQLGYVWLASSYRGEDGSEGNLELCLGEVTDVLEMLEVAAAQPYVDADRIGMYGGSHGGCITLRALQRGAKVAAAADLFGPTDWTPLHAYWQTKGGTGIYGQLDAILTGTVGTPATNQAGYDMRSPIKFVADLPPGIPLLVVHGAADDIVPEVQSCQLAMLGAMPSWHLDATPAEVAAVPPGCDGTGVPSVTTARPRPAWPGMRYAVIYDGLGHETTSDAAQTMLEDAATFFMAKLGH